MISSIEIAKSTSATKQKSDRYEMHKYWGKKPANDLNCLISKFTKEGDLLLDPFAGYGVFCCEAYIMQRNVICNDLNPIANFIQKQLFRKDINFNKLENEFNIIASKLSDFIGTWYAFGPDKQIAVTILRNNKDEILKCKYQDSTTNSLKEYTFTESEALEFKQLERDSTIVDWYPQDTLIENSRISAKKGMKISDLFTKRTLACNARLLSLIEKNSTGPEKDLLLLAFTSNIANCSKLVPPINTRGEMAQGAWMTGFYWGETYLENNVLHYFKNRYNKIVKGKIDFLSSFSTMFHTIGLSDIRETSDISIFSNKTFGYNIKNEDTRNLSIPTESIDYVFTDPPYGDSVPYFEQSSIWNNWLKLKVDYEKEIVVSNSPLRDKGIDNYCEDISKAILEIYRVLKKGSFFSITFHSLSGREWNGLTNACLKAGFEIFDFEWLAQKTFTPRQLNRGKSVKGDVLVTFKKPFETKQPRELSQAETVEYFEKLIETLLAQGISETNQIFMKIVKDIFLNHVLLADVNFFDILSTKYVFANNEWSK